MNFEQSNSFMQEEEKKSKKKKMVICLMAICGLLIIALFALIMVVQYQDSQALKMYFNGQEIVISGTLFKQVEETTYINAREIGQMLGYHYTQGEYNKYNENETSCYLTNDYEIVTLTAEEEKFVKYSEATGNEHTIAEIKVTIKSENGQSEKYALNNKIKLIDGSIYVPFESLTDMFNAKVDLSQENRIKIYSFEQIVASGKNTIGRLKYDSMSGDYENLKAILYGLAVVGDGTNFGVISLTDGKEIIGIKYDDITFIPNLQNFLIKVDNAVGMFSGDGSTVIKLNEYDDISVYDEEHQLYLVRKQDKYGILNRLGKVILYPDYDQIGYEFSSDKASKEKYTVIYDKCIPVKESGKYGLFSIEGEQLLSCSFDEFGSKLSNGNSSGNEKAIFLIPPEVGVKGIIINNNGEYGLYDVNVENIIIPCACTRAYSITKSAQTTYYVEHAGVQYNLDEYLEAIGAKSEKLEDSKTENTVDDRVDETGDTEETMNNTTVLENTVSEDSEVGTP